MELLVRTTVTAAMKTDVMMWEIFGVTQNSHYSKGAMSKRGSAHKAFHVLEHMRIARSIQTAAMGIQILRYVSLSPVQP